MKPLTFGSLFAGIGGFDVALERCGWRCEFQAESDAQCRSVLRRHFPVATLYEDVRDVTDGDVRLITAGWPCQGNSVAGRRAGMADERSGLWGEVVRVLAACRPQWFLGENVPGILSVNGGRDWLTVLRDLAELGYGFAYRVFDAQWFGVAQRRRRVFLVASLGGWRNPAEVLFERESLPWNPAPSREAGTRVAASLTRGTDSSGRGGYAGRRREDDVNIVAAHDTGQGWWNQSDVSGTLRAEGENRPSRPSNVIAHTLRAEGHDASEDGTGRGTPIVTSYRTSGNCGVMEQGDKTAALNTATDPNQNIVAYQCHGSNVGPMGTVRSGNGNETGGVPFTIQERAVSENPTNGPQGKGWREDQAFTLESRHHAQAVALPMAVRRLTPRECERLQGLPDDWTRWGVTESPPDGTMPMKEWAAWLQEHGKEISDSARYRMIGNAVAVPVAEWIGKRLMEAIA